MPLVVVICRRGWVKVHGKNGILSDGQISEGHMGRDMWNIGIGCTVIWCVGSRGFIPHWAHELDNGIFDVIEEVENYNLLSYLDERTL